MNKALRKYLATYAEPAAAIGRSLEGEFARVVVIPAYGEGSCLDQAVATVPTTEPVLVIIVINSRVDSPTEVVSTNDETTRRLRSRYGVDHLVGEAAFIGPLDHSRDRTSGSALLLVERRLPTGEGVGLARKIGCDIALGAWAAGRIASRWIHCTDADVQLPASYFDIDEPESHESILLYPFRHQTPDDPTDAEAILRYEITLRYYVLGLRHARSPWAFHTIGSTMAINADAYCIARGFPRRPAAEDFYMLNKLAKLGRVVPAQTDAIQITARRSTRVPFGTGRALEQAHRDRMPVCYSPEVFRYVAATHTALNRAIVAGESLDVRSELAADLDHDLLARSVAAIGLARAFAAARRACPKVERLRRRTHEWFDAFRTMKLIHELRNRALPSLAVEAAVAAAPFVPRCRGNEDLATTRDRMIALETA